MNPSARRVTLIAVCVLSSACSGESADRVVDHPDYQGPNVMVLEPVLLEESDQYHLGNPSSLVVDTLDGSFLVSDYYSGRMFRFGRDGSVVRTYGRPGSGPGEFQGIGPAFVLNDSVVVGADMGRRQLSRFVSGTGEHAGVTPYPGTAGLTTTVVDGVALIPSVDLDSMKAMVVWDPAGGGSLRHVIDLPEIYRRSLGGAGVFMGMFGLGTVAAWPDTMLFGMGGTNEVYVATWDGEVIDTVHLPNVRRRGIPHDAQERIDDVANPSTTFNERMEMLSVLQGLYVMSDGATVFIHHDIEVVGEPPMVEFLATIHASVLSSDRTTACVDGPVEFANEMRVVHTMARDTLYLLDRTLNEAEDAMMTWIRRYGIDTSACEWLPVG